MNIKYLLFFSIVLFFSCKNELENQDNASQEMTEASNYEVVFLNVNGTDVKEEGSENLTIEKGERKNLDLTSAEDFWKGKSGFFMRGMGAIKVEEPGKYFFKLTSAGKAKVQLNNVDLIVHHDFHSKESKTGERILKKGNALFDFEYFPGDQAPFLQLEWSEDGEKYAPIPENLIFNAAVNEVEPMQANEKEDDPEKANTLSEEEKAAGWKLLFDGKTLNGWHTYNNPGSIGSRWKVEDGALKLEGYPKYLSYNLNDKIFYHANIDKKAMGGLDIVTDASFENFEFMLDWKISKHGNSGIFYTVQEIENYYEAWNSSPEMQVLHDQGQKDGLIPGHRSGDLYDLIACGERRTKPQGEWNTVKIFKNNGKVEHWMNGGKVLEYDIKSADWNQMIDNSKFLEYKEHFGSVGPGKIGLQDHDDTVWYRNIKIREL